jgi:hypothetical protein
VEQAGGIVYFADRHEGGTVFTVEWPSMP